MSLYEEIDQDSSLWKKRASLQRKSTLKKNVSKPKKVCMSAVPPTLSNVTDRETGAFRFNQFGQIEAYAKVSNYVPREPSFVVGVTDEYDPLYPNEFEQIVKQLEIANAEQLPSLDNTPNSFQTTQLNSGKPLLTQYDSDSESDDEKPHSKGKAAIPPPYSLTVNASTPMPHYSTDARGVANNIMRKYGYKEGGGLGKRETGISKPLEVVKTSSHAGYIVEEKTNLQCKPKLTELLKNQTKILVLYNTADSNNIDNLKNDIISECSKYGKIDKCIIHLTDEDEVWVYLKFERKESAIKALISLNDRYFNERLIATRFVSEEQFDNIDL
ncbi:splicing factor [Intoshia linei]|uniref:Splicing factor n=1 Tax=Intoshia linei TaxID=1819745 RepID=A0A177AWE3_9BILA|nr:splicing factor [Intoshia linei]